MDIFFNLTSIRRHVKSLSLLKVGNVLEKFPAAEQSMTAYYDKQLMYANLCNGDNLINDIRVVMILLILLVKVVGFTYKSKYCALCHGLQTYSNITLETENFEQPTEICGIETIFPDQSRVLHTSKATKGVDKILTLPKFSFYLPDANELNCLEDYLIMLQFFLRFNSSIAAILSAQIQTLRKFKLCLTNAICPFFLAEVLYSFNL